MGLLRLMDPRGSSGRRFRFCRDHLSQRQSGNEELFAAVKSHRDRLIPLAVINPFYAGWRDDLEICHQQFGMQGLRLYPKWHNYALADPCAEELISAAVERNLPVSIPFRVEDYRQRSWLVDVPDIRPAEVVDLVKKHPKGRFLLLNAAGLSGTPLGRPANRRPTSDRNFRRCAVLGNEIDSSRRARPRPPVLAPACRSPILTRAAEVEVLDAPEQVKEQVRRGNAAGLFGDPTTPASPKHPPRRSPVDGRCCKPAGPPRLREDC